ncbi:hypothetical protein B0T16DRAFT_319638 [Cercophora newfieldiana]|uniref:PHD-type domain-containing protein n=1 Tax=Cercophora newfieldiana TaxID=92897 RepID=A0AA39YQB4_9PEZI|nr:hypothetical protein B0T16DRAFT_319638 [Cercophora newfieldiana]
MQDATIAGVPNGNGALEGDGNHSNLASPASSAKPSAAKRKKGTATTIKAPKRARPSGSKKKGAGAGSGGVGGAKKKTPATVPGAPEEGADEGADDPGGASSGESDSGPYCLCRGPDNHRFMIACDRCEDWFHGECIGMDKYTGENLVQKYICPNCSDNNRYVTRYKKMCSLNGCNRPARVHDLQVSSIFCSPEHCQAWWEQLIAGLPKTKGVGFDNLTQEEFVGLLETQDKSWKLGDIPFGVSPDFWDTVDINTVLTTEERSILERSAADRYELGEKIELCRKMLQLMEMAVKRREAAIAAGKGTAKDLCGYDTRLGAVGVTYQFGVWLQTPEGEATFKAGRLEAPITDGISSTSEAATTSGETPDPLTAGMCIKKKCKPHSGWNALLTKMVKHDMRELASEAKEKLDREHHVRNSAARRWKRKHVEKNSVHHYNSSSEMEET